MEENGIILREAIKSEWEGVILDDFTNSLDPAQEVEVCEEKLSQVETDVINFNVNNRANEQKRITSLTLTN